MVQSEDSAAAKSIAEIPRVKIQKKGDHISAVDFRQCGEGWSTNLPLLAKLPFVESLSFGGSEATNETIQAVAGHLALRTLVLEKTAVTDDGLAHLKNAAQIEVLDLSGCLQSSDQGLASLKDLTKLRNLKLAGKEITNASLVYLAGLTELKALSLLDCGLTDEDLSIPFGINNLRELSLARTKVGDKALTAFGGNTNLAKLNLRETKVSSQGLVDHLINFPSLTNLDLSETQIDDQALAAIAKLEMLGELNLLRTRVSNDGLAALSATKLKRLNLDDIDGVGDSGMESVSKISTLEWLHVGKTKITDTGLAKLESLVNLKELVINDTVVTENAIKALQEKIPNLKKIVR